jgi:hypothetical protein
LRLLNREFRNEEDVLFSVASSQGQRHYWTCPHS